MGEVARRHHVGNGNAGNPRHPPRLGNVDVEKCSPTAGQSAERMKRLDHARPLRPPAADPGRERDDSGLTTGQGLEPQRPVRRSRIALRAADPLHIPIADILD